MKCLHCDKEQIIHKKHPRFNYKGQTSFYCMNCKQYMFKLKC